MPASCPAHRRRAWVGVQVGVRVDGRMDGRVFRLVGGGVVTPAVSAPVCVPVHQLALLSSNLFMCAEPPLPHRMCELCSLP